MMIDKYGIYWVPAGAMPPFPPLPKRKLKLTWHDKKFTLFWDGFITIENFTDTDYYNMCDWLTDNLDKKYKITKKKHNRPRWRTIGSSVIMGKRKLLAVCFKDKEDAMAFKLRWM